MNKDININLNELNIIDEIIELQELGKINIKAIKEIIMNKNNDENNHD